jgi:hypothetical protein
MERSVPEQIPGQKTAVAVLDPAALPPAYEMRVSGKWMECVQGRELPHGWLEFQRPDGRKGLAPSGTWRRVQKA